MPKIQIRRDTAANWKSVNPILLSGEWALETDTKKMKIGDGSTAYNALPYSTAEDSDEWRKPDDWIDIRSGALPNSVYFLVAHSVPTESEGTYSVATYPVFAVYATVSNSGTYDVYVDGQKIYTTTSSTATEIDWATLYTAGTLVGGYDVTHPSTLTTHIVRVTPTTSTDTISGLSLKRPTGQTGNYTIGLLWTHFTLTNKINLVTAFTNAVGYYNCRYMEAVTSSTGSLSLTSLQYVFADTQRLVTIPVIYADNATQLDNFLTGSLVKKLEIKNFDYSLSLRQAVGFSNSSKLKEINMNGKPLLVSNYIFQNCINLKKLPPIEFSSSNAQDSNINITHFLEGCKSLENTVIDATTGTALKRLVIGGASTLPITGLKGLIVSNEAPFDNATAPQLDVSYTGLSRAALVNLFKSMPYNVGYTVVGTPTIADGIASGFSNESPFSYLQTSVNFDSSKPFEWKVKFIPGVLGSVILFGKADTKYGLLAGGSTLTVQMANGTNVRISNISWSNNSWYTAIYTFDGTSTYTLSLYDANNTLVGTASGTDTTNGGTFPIRIGAVGVNGLGGTFTGSIDLNETYIKVDGVTWFNGKTAMTKTCSVVGCTGTADLTVEDKAIATGKGWELTVA